MPGVRTGMEVSNTHRGAAKQPNNDSIAVQSAVKDEDGNDDIFAESDSDDGYDYKSRPKLPQPNVHMRSLGSLIKELESGAIDVDPEYQREVVWTADRMTGLINSLMENYYIPPIILNKKRIIGTDGTPRGVLVCVDGKQRLSSVRAFVKGMIPCHDHKGQKWWFCETPINKRKKVLPSDTQKSFLEKDFVAFQFAELTPVQEEDLFARVQMGVQLTLAERMRAKQGPWQELAKLFVEDFPMIYNLMKDRARAKDFQLTLSCFSQILEVQHPTPATGIPALRTSHSLIPKLLNNTGAVDDALKSHLASVWTTFRALIALDPDTFTNADRHLSGVQTFAPVEMVAVTVLISMYSETRNNELLLGDIRALREAFREHFKDLRLSAPIWKFAWDFIENLEGIRGAVDGTTIDRNQPAEAPKPTPSTSRTKTLSSPTSAVSRKRVAPLDKPLSILPPRDSIIGREETQPIPTAPKRQRTDPGPSNAQAEVNSPVYDINGPSQVATARNAPSERVRTAAVPTRSPIMGNIFTDFGSQQPSPVSATSASPRLWRAGEALQLNPALTNSPQTGPTRTTSGPPHQHLQRPGNGHGNQDVQGSAPAARGAAEQSIPSRQSRNDPAHTSPSDPRPQPPQADYPDYYIPNLSNAPMQAYHQSRLPVTQLYATHSPFTPEHTPPQIQQARVPDSGNHPAPVAQMQPSRLSHTTSRYVPQTDQSLQNGTPMSSRPPSMTQAHSTSKGAFAPTHTDAQWEGVIASASPRMQSRQLGQTQQGASSAAPSPTIPTSAPTIAASQPSGTKRKSVTRPTPAQYDGVIDLTSDDELEEERQNLLSSFKAKTAPAKQPPATATTKPASTQRKPIVIHDLDLDEDYTRANNPFERFRNDPRAGLSGSKR